MVTRTKDADPNLTRRQAENIRARIAKKASGIVRRLDESIHGKIELSTAQVAAAKTLLSKVLPDQQRIEAVEDKTPRSKDDIERDLIKALEKLAKESPDKVQPILAQLQVKSTETRLQ